MRMAIFEIFEKLKIYFENFSFQRGSKTEEVRSANEIATSGTPALLYFFYPCCCSSAQAGHRSARVPKQTLNIMNKVLLLTVLSTFLLLAAATTHFKEEFDCMYQPHLLMLWCRYVVLYLFSFFFLGVDES